MATKTSPTAAGGPPAVQRYVDAKWVATYLGVTERWVRRQVSEREIPFHKFRSRVRFDRLEIEAWAVGNRVEPFTEEDFSWNE